MLSVALRSVRARWVGFIGTFLAVAIGVGLIATMGLALASSLDSPRRGPERFAHAPVVVAWGSVAAMVGACAVLAVVFAVVTAGVALRRGAIEVVGVRE